MKLDRDPFGTALLDALYRPGGLWKLLPEHVRLGFVSGAIFAAVTHLYAFVNILVNHDSTSTFFCTSSFLDLARWACRPFTALGSDITLPVVMGLLSVFYLAAASALTVKVLNIRSPLFVVLSAALMTTFPPLASVFAYASEWFLAALLLNAIAVYALCEWRRGWPVGIAFLTLGLGVYQSYLGFAVALLVFDCVLRLLADEAVSDVLRRGVKYIFSLLVSILLFYVILEIFLRLTGTELRAYKGLDTMGFSAIGSYLANLPKPYREMFSFYSHTGYLSRPMQLVQHTLLLAGMVSYAYLAVRRKLYRKPAALALQLLGFAMLPLAAGIAALFTPAPSNTLNQYAYVLLLVFCLKLVSLAVEDGLSARRGKAMLSYVLTAALCAALVWSSICVNNLAYVQMHVMYDNSLSLTTRITERVEELDDYSPEMPVAFVGSPNFSELYMHGLQFFEGTGCLVGVNTQPIGSYSTRTFFKIFTGVDFPGINGAQQELLEQSGVLDSMPSFPCKGSVISYEGIAIVKLSDGNLY